MKLMTKEIEKAFKKYPLKSQANMGDEMKVVAKFFDPMGSSTWYATEGQKDGGDFMMYGLADLGMGFPEFGYWTLGQLEEVAGIPRKMNINGRMVAVRSLPIERDIYLTPGKFTVKQAYELDHGPGSWPFSFDSKPKQDGLIGMDIYQVEKHDGVTYVHPNSYAYPSEDGGKPIRNVEFTNVYIPISDIAKGGRDAYDSALAAHTQYIGEMTLKEASGYMDDFRSRGIRPLPISKVDDQTPEGFYYTDVETNFNKKPRGSWRK